MALFVGKRPAITPENIDLLNQAELAELKLEIQRDWRMLNELFNATAEYHSWCSTWERHVEEYNRSFAVLKLQGRTGYRTRIPVCPCRTCQRRFGDVVQRPPAGEALPVRCTPEWVQPPTPSAANTVRMSNW